jgi:hypothetical protein
MALPLVLHLVQKERLLLFSPVHTPTMFRVNPPQIVDEAFIDDMLARVERGLEVVGAMSNEDLGRFLMSVQSRVIETQKARGLA